MTRRIRLIHCLVLAALLGSAPAFSEEEPAKANTEQSVAEVRGDIAAAAEGWRLIGQGALLIDVRSAEEYGEGHIEGSLNIPHTEIDALVGAIGPDKDRQVVVYCRSGGRSGKAQNQLEEMGYSKVFNATGYTALEAARP